MGVFERQLAAADPDMPRLMIMSFADALMSAEADATCGAEYGQVGPERSNSRNGYRTCGWDTRVGSIDLAIPKLRAGSYFPDWLLERRRRAEQALMSVVATAYLLGVSTRRVERLAAELGVTRLSKSQVSAMAKHLDEQVAMFRDRPLDAGPYAVVRVDALTQKVRENGRAVNVHALMAVGVDGDGTCEILGIDVASAEDGTGWLALLRSLTARGLSGVQLAISDAHRRWRPSSPRQRSTWTRPGGPAGVHRVLARDLAADLVQQRSGAVEQGDPPPHRRRRSSPTASP